MSKQDRQGVRTATDLERKYQFGKTFAEVIGIAEAAREAAEESKESYENLDHDEIFNLLTKNGELQGLYRGEDGELYINAEYIKSLEKLFAKDIFMTGRFESTGEDYLPPTYESCICLLRYINFPEDYPLPEGYEDGYDINGDGVLNSDDVVMMLKWYKGELIPPEIPGAKKSPVLMRIDMSNSDSMIYITGTNQFGFDVEINIGTNPTICSFALRSYVDQLMQQDFGTDILYRSPYGTTGVTEYINPPMEEGVEYRTAERYNGKEVYTQLVSFGTLPRSGMSYKAVGVDHTTVISLTGRCFKDTENNMFPVYLGGSIGCYCWVDASGIGVRAVQDMSTFSAEFIIKYYKD